MPQPATPQPLGARARERIARRPDHPVPGVGGRARHGSARPTAATRRCTRWSVDELDTFWQAVTEWFDVRFSTPYARVLGDRSMPGAQWFPGATLNYAEHALRAAGPARADEPALLHVDETHEPRPVTWSELRRQVGSLAAELRALGVRPGDRVSGYLPNVPQAVVALLATAAVGAVWTSCAPDFGARSVLDRFQQVEPVVLFTVDGYRYGGKEHDRRDTVAELRRELPTLRAVVHIPLLGTDRPRRRPRLVRPHLRRRDTGLRAGRLRPPAVGALLLGHDRPAQGHRPVPGRHPRRAPQAARPALRPGPGGPLLLVHVHRLDDVELPRLRPPDRHARSSSTTAAPATPTRAPSGGSPNVPEPPSSAPRRPTSWPAARPECTRPATSTCPRSQCVATTGSPLPARRIPLAARRVRGERPVDRLGQRRHRRVLLLRGSRTHPPGAHRRTPGPRPRHRPPVLGPERQAPRRRGRRTRRHQPDAVHADPLLERPRRQPLPRQLLRHLSRRVAPRRLDHPHLARLRDHPRPLRLHAQPPGRTHGIRRHLRSRRTTPRDPGNRSSSASNNPTAATGCRCSSTSRPEPSSTSPPEPHQTDHPRAALPAPRPRRGHRGPRHPAHPHRQAHRGTGQAPSPGQPPGEGRQPRLHRQPRPAAASTRTSPANAPDTAAGNSGQPP